MLVRHRGTNQFYAMKILDKQKVSSMFCEIASLPTLLNHINSFCCCKTCLNKGQVCRSASCKCRRCVSDERKWSASSLLLVHHNWKPQRPFIWEFWSLNTDVEVVQTGVHAVALLEGLCSLEFDCWFKWLTCLTFIFNLTKQL